MLRHKCLAFFLGVPGSWELVPGLWEFYVNKLSHITSFTLFLEKTMVIGRVYKKPRIDVKKVAPPNRNVIRAASGAIKRFAPVGVPLSYKVGRAAGRIAGKVIPGLSAAATAYDVYSAVRSVMGGKKKTVDSKRSTTKFAGYVKRPRKRAGVIDMCARNGFVLKSEKAYETVSSAGDASASDPAQQVLYQAHSTMPAQATLYVCISALLKKLFNKAGYNIKNYEDVILDGSSYKLKVRLYYKIKDGDAVATQDQEVALTETFAVHVGKWVQWLEGLASTASLPQHFLFLRLYDWFGAVDAPQLKCALDLASCSFTVHSKSEAKIQNRSVTSSGVSSENVDNTPLKGRYFDYRTNGTIFRDYNEPSSATVASLTTDRFYGVLPKYQVADLTGTKMYDELPSLKQFVGVKKFGEVRIQPGDFKTSVMLDKTTIGLNKLVNTILAKGYGDTTNKRYNQLWLGKTRLFAFEKELSTVVGTKADGYGVKVGFEHQYELGAICNIYESKFSSPRVTISNGEI